MRGYAHDLAKPDKHAAQDMEDHRRPPTVEATPTRQAYLQAVQRKAEGELFPWERTDLVADLKAALGR